VIRSTSDSLKRAKPSLSLSNLLLQWIEPITATQTEGVEQ
jgi:hypothetical protein